MFRYLGLILCVAAAGACVDEPISYSAPVTVKLNVKSNHSVQGVVTEDKSITSESGNPFGEFIKDAKDSLGRDPSRVEIHGLEMVLGANSSGVLGIEDVFDGRVEILFYMDGSSRTYVAGDVNRPTGTTATVSVRMNTNEMDASDYGRFLNSSFKVVIRGPAAAGFEDGDVEGEILVTFRFAAYE